VLLYLGWQWLRLCWLRSAWDAFVGSSWAGIIVCGSAAGCGEGGARAACMHVSVGACTVWHQALAFEAAALSAAKCACLGRGFTMGCCYSSCPPHFRHVAQGAQQHLVTLERSVSSVRDAGGGTCWIQQRLWRQRLGPSAFAIHYGMAASCGAVSWA
jgi:hypothetical protein